MTITRRVLGRRSGRTTEERARRRRWRQLAAVAGVALLATACGATSAPPTGNDPSATPVVRTDAGGLRGVTDGDVVRFDGIPYAQPPVGPLRWAPPVPVRPWTGTRDATRSGHPCPQNPGDSPEQQTNEDCLILDVTAPAKPGRGRPVMVFVHGGGFSSGSGSLADPRRMAVRGDTVVVTINYRHGAMGFLALPGMTGGGQFGLADQQEALRFVQRNAAAFGGDPRNVTLFGESGGGISTCVQLTSPSARGLFQRAILQSAAGSCGNPVGPDFLGPGLNETASQFRPLPEREQLGMAMMARLGCTDPTTVLACAHALPVDRLLTVNDTLAAPSYGAPGGVLPRAPIGAIADGQVNQVPVLSGFTGNEPRLLLNTALVVGLPPMVTPADYRTAIVRAYGARADAVLAQYPLSRYSGPNDAWSAVTQDQAWACPQLMVNDDLATRNPVWTYEFADRDAPLIYGPEQPGLPRGAGHGSEIAYLFDAKPQPGSQPWPDKPLTPEQLRLGDRMIDVWTRFARTGDPGTPRWGSDRRAVVFGERAPDADLWTRHRCDFWADDIRARTTAEH